jgi:ABC-type multidrug transport system fused ATPase/permease subunit
VPQDPTLLNGTIASNILYAMPQSKTMSEVEEAARAAAAIMRRPRVLVLNEATAALNNESEVAVAVAISSAAAFRNVTVLLIAHRVSSLRRAHRVADVRPLFGL